MGPDLGNDAVYVCLEEGFLKGEESSMDLSNIFYCTSN